MIGNGQVDVDRVRESSGESKGDVGAMGGNQSRTLSQTMIDSANGKKHTHPKSSSLVVRRLSFESIPYRRENEEKWMKG